MSNRTRRGNGTNGVKVHIYRSYRFIEKDPIIDKCRTLIAEEGLKETQAAMISDLSPATLNNWFHGDTKRPHFSSIAALTMSLGYEIDFKKAKNKSLDIDEELKAAAEWREKQKAMKGPPERLHGAYRW